MFDILKALRDLNEACRAHDTRLTWYIQDDSPGFPVLMAEIPLKPEDKQFTEDMQRFFAPRGEEG